MPVDVAVPTGKAGKTCAGSERSGVDRSLPGAIDSVLRDPAPDIVALLLRAHPDFGTEASFAADISSDGRLTTDWLAVGPAGVALIRDGGVTLLAGGEIDRLATHRYLSGGRLVAQRNGSVRLLARYSGARLASAEEFAQAANRVLRSGATGALEREAAPAAEPVAGLVQEEAPAAGGRVLPRLFAMMPASKYWRVPVIAVALAAGAGASVMTPLLAGRFLFDEVLAPDGRFAGRLLLAVGLILLALLAEVGAKVTWGWTNAAFIHDLEVTLKRSAVGSLQRLSMRFYSARHTGEMMTRLEQDWSRTPPTSRCCSTSSHPPRSPAACSWRARWSPCWRSTGSSRRPPSSPFRCCSSC